MRLRTALVMHPQDKAAQDRMNASHAIQFLRWIMRPLIQKREKVILASLDAYGIYVKEDKPDIYEMVESICKNLEIKVPECYVRDTDYEALVLELPETTVMILSPDLVEYTPEDALEVKLVQIFGVLLDYGVGEQNAINELIMTILEQSSNPLAKLAKLILQKYFNECKVGRKLTGDRLGALYYGGTTEVVREAIYDAGNWSETVGEDQIQLFRDRAFRNLEESQKTLEYAAKRPPLWKYVDFESPSAKERVVEITEWEETDEFKKLFLCYHHPEQATEWPAPFSAEEIVGAATDKVIPLLIGTGFTNITTKQVWTKDPRIKDGNVARVLIDGSNSYSLGQWFPQDVPIVVEIQNREDAKKQ